MQKAATQHAEAASEGLPDPATQADADVASTTIRSTDVMEARRTECETFQPAKSHGDSNLGVRIL